VLDMLCISCRRPVRHSAQAHLSGFASRGHLYEVFSSCFGSFVFYRSGFILSPHALATSLIVVARM
jgi:hypothetical protein